MENSLKARLIIYTIISAFTFTYLVLPENASISVPFFIIIQFFSFYLLLYKRSELINKNGFLVFIPMFILSLNSFTSGNSMWRVLNILVSVVLYSAMITLMITKISVKEIFLKPASIFYKNVFTPLEHFPLPFKWCADYNKGNAIIIKRCLLGILITLPCVLFLLIMLSSADMVFSNSMNNFFNWFFDLINFSIAFKIIYGCIVGLYLFGLVFIIFSEKREELQLKSRKGTGDLIILNILLFSILIIYTIFVSIQFKYLFAGATLPFGLNYSQYARRGFFELVTLSILNIGLILLVIYLIKDKIYAVKSLWSIITKTFMLYLTILTFILLTSSFYRMSLYDNEFGYTHLRVLVYGFLIFEAIGLIITFVYIIKPKINICIVYMVLGLCYYLILNIVNIDYVIAKRNIDRYFAGQQTDIAYLMTLSTDAAPQIARLLTDDITDVTVKNKAKMYFINIDQYHSSFFPRWQRFNWSVYNARKIWEGYSESE